MWVGNEGVLNVCCSVARCGPHEDIERCFAVARRALPELNYFSSCTPFFGLCRRCNQLLLSGMFSVPVLTHANRTDFLRVQSVLPTILLSVVRP